jgi:SAM-dependent methyltransferase
MTVQGQAVAAAWQDPEFARAWTAQDNQADILDLPRRMASGLVAQDRPEVRVVLDVASGPGAFLATFLRQFPDARGVCSDASPTMLETARERLAEFGDRVEYVLGDMTDLRGAGLPGEVDVVITSRASHHLDRSSLRDFYVEAAGLLAPGGWLLNLDHIGPDETWNRRLRALRKTFRAATGGADEGVKHHHNYPLCGIQDHLDGIAAAGLTDVDMPWRAFYTCLFAARTAG